MELSRKDMETILNRINSYADEVLPERDPSKVPIRIQLEALKPEMNKLAEEFQISVEDVFITYMDMNTETSAKAEAELQSKLNLN
ncbi:MAG: hypothetical protein K2M46_02155 [Lachnospiraceae bacterium]|nr:hypothetical protein [Lachnospiraceae bacterium]